MNGDHPRRRELTLALCFLLIIFPAGASGDESLATLKRSTAQELWQEYLRAPALHPNLPDVSYAGYGFGERPIPEGEVVADVRKHGAKGDGKADDSDAFDAAIAAANSVGGGAILVPRGRYRLTRVVSLSTDGLILRGEGRAETVLEFERPVKDFADVSTAWYGGMIWVEPKGPVAPTTNPEFPARPIYIRLPARQGDRVVRVDAKDAERLRPLVGKTIPMAWRGRRTMLMQMAGDPSMAAFDWSSWSSVRDGQFEWMWANQIERIEGDQIFLKKPLRLDIDPVGDGEQMTAACFGDGSPYVSGVGIESLTIKFPETKKAAHLKEPGYNAILFRKAAHCWARDVAMINVDNGVNLSESINCTISGLTISGRPNHHGTMTRLMSHDNLIEDFRIESKPHHGINTEGTSSGNVWRRGEMLEGTFDSHCMLSFDSVRTDITIANSGGPGGNARHGPFAGRRMVHWNIRITNGNSRWIASPAYHPAGALVGVTGAPIDTRAERLHQMPSGLNKGCVIADDRLPLAITDLYQAQLDARMRSVRE